MASHLAKIHGTEEDKVNCPFYYKIGACRHGDRCSRIHHKPAFSQTLLIKHLYPNPKQTMVSDAQALEDYVTFYEDVYLEFSKVGRVLELHVVDNVCDHMIGHVYIKMEDEEIAAEALQLMNGRYYDGRILQLEFSPVTDFREARCRDYDEDSCKRGGFCNFLHVKPIPAMLVQSLDDEAEHERREERRRNKKDKKRKREHKRSSKHSSSSRRHNRDDRSSGTDASGSDSDDGGRDRQRRRSRD